MGIFSNTPDYDRTRILEAASRACDRARHRKASALYRRVLSVEPNNMELHARLAPLLAATGRRFDAWTSFEASGRAAIASARAQCFRTLGRLDPVANQLRMGYFTHEGRSLR